MNDVSSTITMAEQAGQAVGNVLAVFIIIGAVIAIFSIVLLIWFIYEMTSINRNTSRTVSAINNLAKQLKNFSSAPAAASSGVNAAAELQRYKSLFEEGVITEDEFNLKKAQILSR